MEPPITLHFPDHIWGPIKISNEYPPGCTYRIPFATPVLTSFETGSFLSQSFAGDDYWMAFWAVSVQKYGCANLAFNEPVAFMTMFLKNSLSLELPRNEPVYSSARSYDIFYLPAGEQKMNLLIGEYVLWIIVPPSHYLQTMTMEHTGMNDILHRLASHDEKGHHLSNFPLPHAALKIVKKLGRTNRTGVALDLSLRLYMLELLRLYCDQLKHDSVEKMLPSTTHEKAIAVRNFILQNLADINLGGVNELASRFYITAKPLTKGFRALTGRTIPQFISDERLKWAESLLQKKAFRIFEIAQLAGFSETTNFIRKFKQKYGYSPGRYGQTLDKPKCVAIHDKKTI